MSEDGLRQIANRLRDGAEEARPRADCPPAERIWAAVTLALPRSERVTIVDHTAECPACAEAWRLAMAMGKPSPAAERVTARRSRPVFLTAFRAAAAAAVVIAAVITYWVARDRTPPDDVAVAPARPADSSPVVVRLDDGGGRITLTADGRLTTPALLSNEQEERLRTVLRSGTLTSAPLLADLRAGGGSLMGATGRPPFRLMAPLGAVVESDRPSFEWSAVPGALAYVVTIADVGANYDEVASSADLTETKWQVELPLRRGRTYAWQVAARTRDGEVKAPSPSDGEIRFHVLSQETFDALAAARMQHGGNHLFLGVLFADAGLLAEAEAEFRALAAANPGAPLPRELSVLMSARRQLQEGRRSAVQ